MKSRKVVPRVILEFRNGLEAMPEIFSCADTLEEAQQAEQIIKKSLGRKAQEIQIGDKR